MAEGSRLTTRRNFALRAGALAGAALWGSLSWLWSPRAAADTTKPKPKPPAYRGPAANFGPKGSLLAPVVDATSWSTYYSTSPAFVIRTITQAWNGAAFDYAGKVMHIVAPGGHSDSWNNQCYAIQVPNGSWTRTRNQTPFPPDQRSPSYQPTNFQNGQPTAGTGYFNGTVPVFPIVNQGCVYFDGAPCSRHTYGCTVWLPTQKRVWMAAGACWPGGQYDYYSGWFDPATGNWERKANVPNPYGGMIAAYDSVRDRVIWCTHAVSAVYSYDPATDTHTRIGPASGDPLLNGLGGPFCQIACDANYVYAVMKGGPVPRYPANTLLRLPLGQTVPQRWEPIPVTGDVTGVNGISPGMEYDPDRNALVFWSVNDPGNISILGLTDFLVTKQALPGAPPSTADTTAGVWGRFRRYDVNSYCLMVSANAPIYLITLA